MNMRERLKMLRIVRILSNLKYFKRLKANREIYKSLGIHRKVWQTLSHSLISKHGDGPWLDADNDEEQIRRHPRFATLSFEVQQKILLWNQNGFLTLSGFFSNQDVDAVTQSLDENLSRAEATAYATNRLMNLYKTNKEVNKLFRSTKLLDLLSFILGKDVHPFQTINFHRSSSQPAHSDAVHLTTEPLGYSLGVWVALEDVREGSGEFFFYPGSHRLPYILNTDFGRDKLFLPTPDTLHQLYEKKIREVIVDNNLERVTYLPKKGDILIWHTNLLHGSLPKVNTSLTRKSLIMHYFAKGVLCYHEMLEKPAVLS